MGYSACVVFKNWSKLWTQGNATQLPNSLSALLWLAGAIAWGLSSPLDRVLQATTGRKRLSVVIQALRRRIIRQLGKFYHHLPKPDCLLIEVFNPMTVAAQLHLCLLGSKQAQPGRFEWTQQAQPGLSSFAIPVADIEQSLDLGHAFECTLSVADEERKKLYFCSATFVRLAATPARVQGSAQTVTSRKIKCVVWDLDHTLWDGILVEAGSATVLQLKDGVRSILEELDRRGILLSIASKNSEDDARKVLERLGIWHLFLVPQINWQPKSVSIQQIAKKLNLGLDTFAFVDDMPFERDEVASALPAVTFVPAEQLLSILWRPEFAGDVSGEGATRRLMYQVESQREQALATSALSFDAFLATCGIRARIQRPGDDLVPRIQDIIQRTNQLNIASQRYNVDETRALIHSQECQSFIVSCSDNYGNYGYVGFITIAVQATAILLRDCMFSCRIQGKRIDEAVLVHLINHYVRKGATAVRARFVPTKRNAPPGEMLARLGFVPEAGTEGVLVIPAPALRPAFEHIKIESDLA